GGLRAIADVIAMTVDEQVRGRAVHELEAALGGPLPVIGRDTFADDASGDRDKLVVDVMDSQLVDLLPDLLYELVAALGAHMGFKIGHVPLRASGVALNSSSIAAANRLPPRSAPRERAVGSRVQPALREAREAERLEQLARP